MNKTAHVVIWLRVIDGELRVVAAGIYYAWVWAELQVTET